MKEEMKLDKLTFKKWLEWIDVIKDDLQGIITYQQICKYFEDVINANLEHIKTNKGNTFCDFIRKCYAITAATCIRRHKMNSQDSISLMKLLSQIKKCASQFTYKFYLETYPLQPNEFEWQKSTFSNFSKDGNVVSEELIEQDMQEIERIAGKVSDFVDRFIAHLDQRGLEEKITYGDLGDSLGLFNKLACKYLALISSAGYVTLTPTFQYDWKKIFTVPLDIRNFDSSNPTLIK